MEDEIDKIIKEEKDVHIQLLKESLWDVRDQRNFFKKLMVILCVLILVLILGVVSISITTQRTITTIATQQQTINNVNSNGDK